MSNTVALQLMQGSLLRVEAIGSRLASATCHRSSPFRPSPLRLWTARRGRRHQQLLASNGSVVASKAIQEPGYQQSGPADPDLDVASITESDHAQEISAQSRARRMVYYHLHHRDPDGLLRAFSEASTDLEYVRSIPHATFTKILALLDPNYFVQTWKITLHGLSAADLLQLGIRPVSTFYADFIGRVADIISKRRQAGHGLDIADYRILLNCARVVGDVRTADAVWDDLYENRLKPDTTCYNHYMEAKCWSGLYEAAKRHKVRVIPHNMVMRLYKNRRTEFGGYAVGKTWGVKRQVVRLFDQMIRQGLLADEGTFVAMMTAMGREGDLKGVKAILTKVWSLDVDKMMAEEEVPSAVVEVYPETSPLRPTSRLLFAIAHIFGSNNDIPTALRLVDHVSRQYSLPIAGPVWFQLLEWTFVLSRKRSRSRKADGASHGQLPSASVGSIWDIMVSEPYNIKPNMPMYNKYIANLNQRQNIKGTLRLMREGMALFRNSYRLYRIALNRYVLALEHARKVGDKHSSAHVRLSELQRELERRRMHRARDYNFLKRWVRLLLGNRRWNDVTRSWDDRGMPDAIEEWRPFLPAKARYQTRTGTVELDIKSWRTSSRVLVRHRRHRRVMRMATRRPVDWKRVNGVGSVHKSG